MAFDYSTNISRKRKVDENEFVDDVKHKILLTEEKLIQNLQTLSLDTSENKSTLNCDNDDDEIQESPIEFHQLLKNNIKRDDLQDEFIHRLYNLERKKFSLQLVPYIPVHPAQLKSNITSDEKKSSPNRPNQADDHVFKKPSPPTPYIVEEPSDINHKRSLRMKRSYSQSFRSNNNVSIIELPNDVPFSASATDCLIFEPQTPSVCESSNDHNKSMFLLNRPTIRISEYVDGLTFSNDNSLSDTCDHMDDDNV